MQATSSPPTRAGANPPLPVLYAKPQALNSLVHGGLGIRQRVDFGFARKAHALPVVASEMPSAMRSYPIVFVGPTKAPVVITGLRPDQNLFVSADGRWSEPHYVPAYVRRYPFVLAEDQRKPGTLTLCVDRAGDRVVEMAAVAGKTRDKVVPLFEAGQPSEATRQALAFCERFQRDFVATRAMVDLVDRLGLFAERRGSVKLESGETLNVTDFRVVDEAALNLLSDEAFLQLRRSGALAMVYCHLASTNSWTSLAYQAKRR